MANGTNDEKRNAALKSGLISMIEGKTEDKEE